MAGKHEQTRNDDGGREDGPAVVAGEYVDSDIPGEQPQADAEPVGST